jgi:hypothetical protein
LGAFHLAQQVEGLDTSIPKRNPFFSREERERPGYKRSARDSIVAFEKQY